MLKSASPTIFIIGIAVIDYNNFFTGQEDFIALRLPLVVKANVCFGAEHLHKYCEGTVISPLVFADIENAVSVYLDRYQGNEI